MSAILFFSFHKSLSVWAAAAANLSKHLHFHKPTNTKAWPYESLRNNESLRKLTKAWGSKSAILTARKRPNKFMERFIITPLQIKLNQNPRRYQLSQPLSSMRPPSRSGWSHMKVSLIRYDDSANLEGSGVHICTAFWTKTPPVQLSTTVGIDSSISYYYFLLFISYYFRDQVSLTALTPPPSTFQRRWQNMLPHYPQSANVMEVATKTKLLPTSYRNWW